MKKIAPILLVLIAFVGCKNDNCESSPSVNVEEINLTHLEDEFEKLTSEEEIQNFLNKHEGLKKGFLMGEQYPDTFIVDYLYRVANSAEGKETIYKECKETFGDFSKWKKEYEDAFALLKHYFPEEKSRNIFTFIPGLMRDLHIDDTSVVVGIDYFIGPKATFRAQNYNYINKRYVPEAIVPMSMVFISTKYNKSNFNDKTLLAEMIYYGKSFYFAKSMLPCVGDSLIIGYSSEEFNGSEAHINRIWSYFVEQEILFETSHTEKKRYIEERPIVTEIGNKCPGRIGQWLGWKIVQAYMDNNDVTLPELMAEEDVKKILDLSKFKP